MADDGNSTFGAHSPGLYRRLAERCEDLAQLTSSPAERQKLLEVAKTYRLLADQLEKLAGHQKVTD